MKYGFIFLLLIMSFGCVDTKTSKTLPQKKPGDLIKLMTLDPGHFHAALVHKSMYDKVDSNIFIYAPKGREVKDFLNKIDYYNNRKEVPTAWNIKSYYGEDYLPAMLSEKPGNVMIVAGKNSKKIDYILAAVEAGLNVYADKPLVIDPEGFKKLKKAFDIADKKGVLIYDIMTERFEATTVMQKLISTIPEIFGELLVGTHAAPAISKESVHHFSKIVSGKPLIRPPWFFDVREEGEGTVDVTTHLVDMIQWEAFPEDIIDTQNINILSAKRWPTLLTKDQFKTVTSQDEYPAYLTDYVSNENLEIFCNSQINYTINNIHAKVAVSWNFAAPEGTGDTHYSIMRGSKSDLIISQGKEEEYRATLYIRTKNKNGLSFEQRDALLNKIAEKFPEATLIKISGDYYKVEIPEHFKLGHEAHFAQVTENYLKYLTQGKLPNWEVPNMIAKYYTTTRAYDLSRQDIN